MTPDEAVAKLEGAAFNETYALSLAATGYSESEISTIINGGHKDSYFQFLNWGPAGTLVKNFLSAYADASLACEVGLNVDEPNIHEIVHELWNDMREAKVGRKLHSWIVMPEYCKRLSENIMFEAGKVLKNREVSEYGLWAICWMITGQVLFPPALVEEFQPYVERVDSILVSLNQPPLGGFFTP